MNRVTLLFTRSGRGASSDDRIHIRSIRNAHNIFKVTYHTPEMSKDKHFYLTYEGVLNYVEDVIRSMRHDNDPFEHIQIYTAIHPSVFFHVSVMDEDEPRAIVMNMTRDAMRLDIS
jgi:hypothetical protein